MKVIAVSAVSEERCFALVLMTAEEVRTGAWEFAYGETFDQRDNEMLNRLIESHTQPELFKH